MNEYCDTQFNAKKNKRRKGAKRKLRPIRARHGHVQGHRSMFFFAPFVLLCVKLGIPRSLPWDPCDLCNCLQKCRAHFTMKLTTIDICV